MSADRKEASKLYVKGPDSLRKKQAFKELWEKMCKLIDESALPLATAFMAYPKDSALDFAQFVLDAFSPESESSSSSSGSSSSDSDYESASVGDEVVKPSE